MVDPTDMPNMLERFERVRAQIGGSGGPTGGDVERRLSALEARLERVDGKLDKILERLASNDTKLASIEAKLETKASASETAGIKGRVDSLPTTWQMITLVIGIVGTILGGSFLILRFGLPHTP